VNTTSFSFALSNGVSLLYSLFGTDTQYTTPIDLYTFLIGSNSHTFYIDSSDGKDIQYCGTDSQKCQQLSYVLTHKEFHKDSQNTLYIAIGGYSQGQLDVGERKFRCQGTRAEGVVTSITFTAADSVLYSITSGSLYLLSFSLVLSPYHTASCFTLYSGS
jgi:hypothetical protein